MSDTELNQKLKAALAQLNADNEAHWTKDGLPAVAFLSILVGGGVTRDMIEQVAPELTRESVLAAALAATQQPQQPESGLPTGGAVSQAPEIALTDVTHTEGRIEDGAVVVVGNAWPMHFRIDYPKLPDGADANNPTDEEVVTALQHLQSLVTRDRDALNIKLAELSRHVDEAIIARERNFKEAGGIHNANSAYMAARKVQLEAKAEQMQKLRKTDLAGILKSLPKPAPIDQALKNRPRDVT